MTSADSQRISLRLRLAIAFREQFEAEFTAVGTGNDAFFTIKVEAFDRFLKDWGFTDYTADELKGHARTGAVVQRNALRAQLNIAAKKGQHGSPPFVVEPYGGTVLRVAIEECLAEGAVPKSMNALVTYSTNKLQMMRTDYDLVKAMAIPAHAKDRITHQMDTVNMLVGGMVDMITKAYLQMEQTKAAALALASPPKGE